MHVSLHIKTFKLLWLKFVLYYFEGKSELEVDLWMLVSDPDSTNLSVAVEMTIMNMVFIFANFSNIHAVAIKSFAIKIQRVQYITLAWIWIAKKLSVNVLNSIKYGMYTDL